MQESKDPAIRLFGRKISLQSDGKDPSISGNKEEGGPKIADKDEDEADKESAVAMVTEKAEEKDVEQASCTNEEEASKSSEKEKKRPKKAEKLLPCPRCKSMDTKFCYFNNYNVNQPRHFCKSCQRYWTAGGAMRNVPVGAGRRKTGKNPSSNYRHISISEALDDHNNNNGKVLNFGSEGTPNGFHRFVDDKMWVPSPFLNAVPPVSLYHPYAVSGNWNWNIVPWLKAEYVQREEEGGGCKSEERNGGVLVPKTLRIDDPSEAAKSSIWGTLGIKRERGMFEAFQSLKKKKKEDGEKKLKKVETCMVLRANPAALSRSLNFHENS